MAAFTIAHISDLHFGGSHDTTRRDHLVNDLKNGVHPDIVVVTGDLTDVADSGSLGQAHTFLMQLCSDLNINPLKHLFIVPGNHDVNNVRGRLYHNWKLRNFMRVDLFGQKRSLEEKFCYLPEFDAAFFAFDSTIAGWNIAEGQVSASEIAEFEAACKRISHRSPYCRKIALLHHHPAPIPYTEADDFLLLRKAGTFLRELMQQGVDLILYGHKHRHFFSRLTYRLEGRDLEVAMIGAGSATKRIRGSMIYNSYNIIRITEVKTDLEVRKSDGGAFKPFEEINVFSGPQPSQEEFDALTRGFGYKHQSIAMEVSIGVDRRAVLKWSGKGLRPVSREDVRFSRPFIWRSDGRILDVRMRNLTVNTPEDLVVFEEEKRDEKTVTGKLVVNEPLREDRPIDYELTIELDGSFFLTREQMEQVSDALVVTPFGPFLDQLKMIVNSPTEELLVSVQMFPQYDFRPKFSVVHAGKQQPEVISALRSLFNFNRAENQAKLKAIRPRLTYGYLIYWELPPRQAMFKV